MGDTPDTNTELRKAFDAATPAQQDMVREITSFIYGDKADEMSGNPFYKHLSGFESSAREHFKKKAAERYAKDNDGKDLPDDLSKVTIEVDGKQQKVSDWINGEVERNVELEKRRVYETASFAALGHDKPEFESVFQNATETAVSGTAADLFSGNGLNLIGNVIMGVKNMVTGFVMNIPVVGKFIRQLTHAIGGTFEGDGWDWDKAGKLAQSDVHSERVARAFGDSDAIDATLFQQQTRDVLSGSRKAAQEDILNDQLNRQDVKTEVADAGAPDKKEDDKTQASSADAPDKLVPKTEAADENKDKPAAEDKNDDPKTTRTEALDEFRSVVMNGSGKPVGENDMPSHGLAFAEGSSVKGSFVG